MLAATSLWFRLYNCLDKDTRVWMFWGLPLARGAGFAAIVPVAPIGAIAIGAHVLAKWVEYLAYRRERRWPDLPTHLVRLVHFAVLAAVGLVAAGAAVLGSGLVPALFLMLFGWKARGDLADVLKRARRIDGDAAGPARATSALTCGIGKKEMRASATGLLPPFGHRPQPKAAGSLPNRSSIGARR